MIPVASLSFAIVVVHVVPGPFTVALALSLALASGRSLVGGSGTCSEHGAHNGGTLKFCKEKVRTFGEKEKAHGKKMRTRRFCKAKRSRRFSK